ncbi:antibiotic biosynthesis monooxygenase family protein [Pseudomonas chlororaphis]|uniref:antibiotic biosynthesis monooxygenase family protein n=1 Tax=Pseudomonas chlororaphis TaxID=587753 RepID=UPI0015DE13E1|nr:antibiotic biosynthesis monooxygenase [Pseudomonas chlororaphis]QLL11959.1 antibiotic biosynthesis monooxygenase [Pseudomonas chlororaphis subsp. aurantiaca]
MIARTPEAPYYAVIFSAQRREPDPAYEQAAERMVELAQQQPGFLGMEFARNEDGSGITVSYWRDQASILAWKQHAEHRIARERGRSDWYVTCHTRVCKVERAYLFER